MLSVVGLLISKGAVCDGRNIRRADERDFAITACCIQLALVFDNKTLCFLGEIFYVP